ncbi:ribosomal large subunit pseudouridine synthase D [Deltaproteobacteria bacterium]|nr:ribosomal large subunit pseudouridine synthase D [Deltaproteobacteria bacterium]
MLTGATMTRDQPHRVLNIRDRAAGRRADTFLSLRFPSTSRSTFAKWIKEGMVQSDDRTLKPSSVLRLGETLRIWSPGLAPTDGPPPTPPILFEDEWLLAIDKPAGMLVHPVGQRYAWALIGLVRELRPDARIDLSHRLDRDTSGVVLLTKHEDANRAMKAAFQSRKVSKTYHAVVRGVVPWEERAVEAPLGHKMGSEVQLRRGEDPEGDSALTHMKVLSRMAAHTLVECRPFTGRTHQIRAHLEIAGFPILGDKLYGQPDNVFLELLDHGLTDRVRALIGFPRHALHAQSLAFPHPKSGQMVKVRAPLPADMQAIVDGAVPTWAAEAAVEDEVDTIEEEAE